VQNIQPAGRGALELAFRQLQAKLFAEGLFAPERKKALPRYPARIVMVTSRATAALQDMLKVLRRFNWLKLAVYHVPVQGEGSGAKIAEAIEHLSARVDDIGGADIILLARGGGSLEDLWAFNEEAVARAVAASRIPVVTGIGHEVDCSISDLVADYHAHTPTEAAQVVTQHWKLAAEMLSQGRSRLGRLVKQAAIDSNNRLTQIHRHEFFRRPLDRIQMLRQLLDDRQKAITLALSARREKAKDKLRAMEPRLAGIEKAILQSRFTQLQSMERHIEALSPAGVLKRGYSITTLKKSGEILRNAQQVRPGDRLLTRVAEGEIQSVVDDAKQMGLFE
jgi:exodeoxyribonuclease VII large subunit